MTRPSKRSQVEALGWTLAPIPHRWEAGTLWRDSRTGMQSAAHDDYKSPDGWTVTPPPGQGQPRRFEGRSPNAAVRWAFDQAHAAPLPAGGVAGLVALATAAGRSGVVVEGGNSSSYPTLPDAELLAICREMAGCARIIAAVDGARPCPWSDRPAFDAAQARISEARAASRQLLPRVLDLEATTPAGALAKARVVAGMFATSRGQKAEAVRGLLASLEVVLQAGT